MEFEEPAFEWFESDWEPDHAPDPENDREPEPEPESDRELEPESDREPEPELCDREPELCDRNERDALDILVLQKQKKKVLFSGAWMFV